MTFTFLKVTFTFLKVTFSNEKVTLFGNKVVFSVQFSREFNRKVYLLGKACQASVSNDHLSDSNGHLSNAHCHLSAFNYTNGTVPFVYERNGHLFQDRFRSEPVDTIEYFVTLLRYIHQNPVKAGIVENAADYPWSSWKEYESDDCQDAFCSTKGVLSRISREDLIELVSVPIEGDAKILDIDTDVSKSVSDSDVKDFLLDSHGIANPLMVQSLEKTRRNEVLSAVLALGAGIRQASRLTGVSFGVIQKIAK